MNPSIKWRTIGYYYFFTAPLHHVGITITEDHKLSFPEGTINNVHRIASVFAGIYWAIESRVSHKYKYKTTQGYLEWQQPV
jgi:hypothetical protein